MRHKTHILLSHIRHTGILVLFVLALITFIFFSRSSQRQNTNSEAAGNSIKIMTFNVLGGDNNSLCASTRNHEAEMMQISNLIRNNSMTLAALQEAKKISTDNCEFDLTEILDNQLNSPYIVTKRQYIGSNDFKWFRAFIHSSPAVSYHKTSPDVDPTQSQGAESIVLDTAVGKIRFINVHPQPGTQAANLPNMLVQYIDQFKGDGIPMILMGDFNIAYDAIGQPMLDRIMNAGYGFYRACDPVQFPNGNCKSSVKGATDFVIDHIFIDKRATFRVKNAYVEQSIRFSDHLPVIVELTNEVLTPTITTQLPNPTGLTRVCNTNGTATFRWNAVSGAGEYAFRLDEQGTNPSSPIHNWKTSPPDIAINTSSTAATVNVSPGRYYQWAVTAVRAPGNTHAFPTWQPVFTCAVATFTPTRIPPTATRTPTRIPPTSTMTPTRVPPTPTLTPTRTPSIGPPTITPTRTPTPRIITATPAPTCSMRSRGDADCNGQIDVVDFICWKEEFRVNRRLANCQRADFNTSDSIDLLDYTIWKQAFLNL